MVGKVVGTFEEIGVGDRSLVGVIPSNVYGVPLVVVHLHICPHVRLRASLADDEGTGNVESVAKHLKGFGIAFADKFLCTVEKRSDGMSVRSDIL